MAISATVLPGLRIISDKERYDRAEKILVDMEAAITKFRANLLTNPGRLSQLATPITTSDSSPCGTYAVQDVNAWPGTPPAGGPYIKEVLPRDSFAIGTIGTANDKLTRDPPTTGGQQRFHFLLFNISGVQRSDAQELNDRIDGSADTDPNASNNLTGTVQWNVPDAQGFVTVTYRMVIPKNRC